MGRGFIDLVEGVLGALADRPQLGVGVALIDGDELGTEAEPDDGNVKFIGHNRVGLGGAEAALPCRPGWKRIHNNEIKGLGRIKAPSILIIYDSILTFKPAHHVNPRPAR